jgi:hypothetical protein
MDDVIEHSQRLQFFIQSVEEASVSNLTSRVKALAAERETFHRVLTDYYKTTFPVGEE